MKALILSAGYGTRLLPHTQILPKPLFPINGRPLVDRIIGRLIESGCTGIILNIHHLHRQIAEFVRARSYPVPVETAFEAQILGTGGAIRNVSAFLKDQPFLVINSDIVTDLDFAAIYRFHLGHPHPATLVMHDYQQFNKVWVDECHRIASFREDPPADPAVKLAFTGIQVLDPQVIDWIPENRSVGSIGIFQHMIDSGCTLAAYMAKNHYWRDVGTPESYFEAVYEQTMPAAFQRAFGVPPEAPVTRVLLAGDGSDRKWYRITSAGRSLIMADHGITAGSETSEIDAFVNIGSHLLKTGVPVPEIYFSDRFSGIAYMADLGDIHLQSAVLARHRPEQVIDLYKQVIDHLAHMSLAGADGFDPDWPYQTPRYDRELILERECRYFVEALLNQYLGIGLSYEAMESEFEWIAANLLENAVSGFMHRDLQSRNIMVKDGRIGFIDFQGGRLGPVQYDLAALLCDPYVHLSPSIKERLLEYALSAFKKQARLDAEKFIKGYRFCAVTRLLQALGAFGFLAGRKKKAFFADYIPIALETLTAQLQHLDSRHIKKLQNTVSEARKAAKVKARAQMPKPAG